jgi:S1-C subfamily serine protease
VVNVLDVVLVVVAVLAAWSGWRQGLISGVLSFVGFIGGALVGALVAPRLLGDISGLFALALAVVIVIVGAGIGNAVASLLGGWIRSHVTWQPARVVDSAGGSMFSILTVAVVAWVVASAAIMVPLGPVSTQVRGSAVLGEIDRVLPETTRDWVSGLRGALDSTGFPQAFAGFTLDPVIPVEEPDPSLLKEPAVRRASGSLVKIEGIARECGTEIDGSGFVYAPDRVMTNAHVVAGVDRPRVLVRGVGRAWPATVVYLDPRIDVAVLAVPGLSAPELEFTTGARRGDAAVVAGFPGGGPLTAAPARIRGTLSARGTDIYDRGTVTREVYALRGEVRPGNSGGPLLSPEGKVDGVVFASAIDDPDTGYALTARQVSTAAREGAAADAAVDTGSCATR